MAQCSSLACFSSPIDLLPLHFQVAQTRDNASQLIESLAKFPGARVCHGETMKPKPKQKDQAGGTTELHHQQPLSALEELEILFSEASSDLIWLWLDPGNDANFDARRAVSVPREKLVRASPLMRDLLDYNPNEYRVPLMLDQLGQRSVSVEALQVAAAFIEATQSDNEEERSSPSRGSCHLEGTLEVPVEDTYALRMERFYAKYCPDKIDRIQKVLCAYAGNEDKLFEALVSKYGPEPPGPEVKKVLPAPLWTNQYDTFFEDEVLPLLHCSDGSAFRRQQLLKVFGELLELGRYLEINQLYDFALLGGVGMLAGRIDAADDAFCGL